MAFRFCIHGLLIWALERAEYQNAGKVTFAYELYFVVKAFRLKLKLFSRHLNENNFTHFAKLETTEPSVMTMKKYNNVIVSLDNEFCRCFADF